MSLNLLRECQKLTNKGAGLTPSLNAGKISNAEKKELKRKPLKLKKPRKAHNNRQDANNSPEALAIKEKYLTAGQYLISIGLGGISRAKISRHAGINHSVLDTWYRYGRFEKLNEVAENFKKAHPELLN